MKLQRRTILFAAGTLIGAPFVASPVDAVHVPKSTCTSDLHSYMKVSPAAGNKVNLEFFAPSKPATATAPAESAPVSLTGTNFSNTVNITDSEGNCIDTTLTGGLCVNDLNSSVVCNGTGVNRFTFEGTEQDDQFDLDAVTNFPVFVNTGGGTNEVDTGPKADEIWGGTGADTIKSGGGKDRVLGGEGNDNIDAGRGADGTSASGDPIVTLVDGEGGNDIISGGPGNDDDVLFGGAGLDTLTGGGGKDTLNGGADNDTLNGGDDDDTFVASAAGDGADAVNGGGGTDHATYEARGTTAALSVTLDGAANDGQVGEGDNVSAENVTGGPGPDTLTGDAGNNFLWGGPGNDTLDGGAGVDNCDGQTGADIENQTTCENPNS